MFRFFFQDAKKAAVASLRAKNQGKDYENVESSMRIFSHLDSYKTMAGHADGDSPSGASPYSSSSATVYPTSSLSSGPGTSDAASSSPPSGSASTSISPFSSNPGFSHYPQEQSTGSILTYFVCLHNLLFQDIHLLYQYHHGSHHPTPTHLR